MHVSASFRGSVIVGVRIRASTPRRGSVRVRIRVV